jgi:lysophospholipase L1-like esterase
MTLNQSLRRLFSLFIPFLTLVALLQAQSAHLRSDTPAGAQPRRNVGAFFNKLRAGRAVTIAYLGGSNPAGLGLSHPEKHGYPALVTDWLRKSFPKSDIRAINASVAHTGSLYAALRARRDLIADKPDLVFVDLATSDAGEDDVTVKKAVEGLLRQLLIVPQPPEVILLYAASPAPNSRIEAYDVIAAHYQLPALHLHTQVQAALDNGKLKAADLWKNGTTPAEPAHKFQAELITAFLAEQQTLTPTPIARTLPGPLLSDELNYGELKTFADAASGKAADWKTETTTDPVFPSELLVSNKPGAAIELYFEGTVVGLSFRVGPDAGAFECLIDGKPAPAPLAKVDCYDNTSHLGARIIAGGLGLGEHKLTLRILPEKNPKSSGAHIRLGYLLVGGTRPERL